MGDRTAQAFFFYGYEEDTRNFPLDIFDKFFHRG